MPVDPRVKARYLAKLADIIKRGELLTDAELRSLVKLLDSARESAQKIILDAPSDWQLAHFGVMRERLQKLMEGVTQDMGSDLLDLETWRRDGTTVFRHFGPDEGFGGIECAVHSFLEIIY